MLFSRSRHSYGRPPGLTGQAALSTVFIIGGIAVFAALMMAFLALSFLNATAGVQAGNRAQAVALGGLNDSLVKLARNKDYATTSSISVPVDNYFASVAVTQNSPSAGQVTIVSNATVSNNTRVIQAVVTVVSSTGEVSLLRWWVQ